MKRTVPLLITAISGFILLISVFIPWMEGLGEDTAVWFDLLAAIAFILGGGNLLKVHLKKISDRAAGWGYSGVTIIAFLLTLYFGLFKVGVHPEASSENYGESFVRFPLDDMPDFTVDGVIPTRSDGEAIPPSAVLNISQMAAEGAGTSPQVVFQGWMSNAQKNDLLEYDTHLQWRCLIEELYDEAQPEFARGRVAYHTDHQMLGFKGYMSDNDFGNLSAMFGETPGAKSALEQLREASRVETTRPIPAPPEGVVTAIQQPEADADESASDETFPENDLVQVVFLQPDPEEDAEAPPFPDEAPKPWDFLSLGDGTLTILGPMTPAVRDQLSEAWPAWPRMRPVPGETNEEFTAARERMAEKFIAELEEHGPELTDEQRDAVVKQFATLSDAQLIIDTVNAAGVASEEEKSACDLYAEQLAWLREQEEGDQETLVLEPERPKADDVVLTEEQEAVIREFAADPELNVDTLADRLKELETEETSLPAAAVKEFNNLPTIALFKHQMAFAVLKAGPLSEEQKEWLFADYRDEHAWRQAINDLFYEAHVVKYPWSGSHEQEGSLFWWCYAYLFRPLVATMFAMLAFYVASAAFRAFRAKNIEALLLLGTAFIILLGRTFVGVWITGWIPESLSAFKVDELTLYVMQIFTTAGNRAIMIGIALGVASTSLKVLLGVDRSYLGSGDD